jgi:putative ABC transport system substrate-binding protein
MRLCLRRREFVAALGGVVVLSSLSPRKGLAQQAIRSVVGFLQSGTPEAGANIAAVFRKGLSEGGYDEGRNLIIDYRWAHNDLNRLPGLAADLVRRRVSVIATLASSDATSAAKAATATIPIVFSMGADPVQIGLVAALNRPWATSPA